MQTRVLVMIALLLLLWPNATPSAEAEREGAKAAPTAKDTLRLLQASEPGRIAWGAWLAGEHGQRETGRLLLKRLADCTELEWSPAAWALQSALLDAAIRLGLLPTSDNLLQLADVHDAAVSTLVITHPRTPATTLLAIYDRYERESTYNVRAWLALGNTMQARKTAGFGMRVLAGLRFKRRLRVWDRYGPYPPYRGPGGFLTGHGRLRIPEGFPPIAVYELSLQKHKENRFLALGPRPVFVSRHVETQRKYYSGVGGSPDRVDCALEWLAAWFSEPARAVEGRRTPPDPVAVLPKEGTIDLRYTGRQPWKRELYTAQRALHERYFDMARALLRRGILREIEAVRLKPAFEFEVLDERVHTRRPLPAFPQLEPRNPWREGRRR